ncbi:hypothetical protein AACH06_27045 [Ideonella sp. DXS29W]|uniref:Uncharacterized protein n=1 Tax=Ideonella lacteola TaxID=2984193 RepID=A0ABU9BYI8_9BURK
MPTPLLGERVRADGHAGEHRLGGRGIYWNQPDVHRWEMLTASYARQRR